MSHRRSILLDGRVSVVLMVVCNPFLMMILAVHLGCWAPLRSPIRLGMQWAPTSIIQRHILDVLACIIVETELLHRLFLELFVSTQHPI